ncbi:OmpA family protein [Wenzhouxiangella sp. XN79A]|uniref:OmpA family protein n=1 Tax=Wenzhouxiangella sp. XN79A TaxID=2724193 RepID=UPI00144A9684|nr:OmpA family protein [Wenzhouxiangella sp. XN79A]NKI35900.1 OmpA family protein [Wenzhouxiangella sp. XN79A]
MKRLALAVSAALLASTNALAQDDHYDDRWYVTVSGGAAFVDEDRLAADDWPYYGVSFGRFFSPNFSLELQLDRYESDFDGLTVPAGADGAFENTGYGLFGRYHWGDFENWRPYVLAGVGIQEHDNFLDDGRDAFASVGIGATAGFGDHWALRTQFEARYDNDRATFDSGSGFVDGILSVGLSYKFGQPPAPPAPPPAPEPRVAPEPEPTPAPPPPPEPEPEVILELDAEVTFEFDSAVLLAAAERELDRVVDIMDEAEDILLVEIAGHTDSVGPEAYNQGLSERRARSVADYLASQGVARDRMQVMGYGESRPKVPNTTPENRRMNRRVVISVIERL